MSSSPIRLVALDLDGTLFDLSLKFSPRIRQAVAAVRARGVAVTLATGRSPLSTRPFARELGIDVPLICYQGGLIATPEGRVLHKAVFDCDLARQVLAVCREKGWHATLYQDGELYIVERRHPPEFYAGLLNPDAHLVDDFEPLLDHDPDKIVIVAEGDGDEIDAGLRQAFDGAMQIVRSHEMFVEANPLGVDKGQGLAWVAGYLQAPQGQVMAVGDQDNDAAMLEWAGLGVAMGNASPLCKSAADWIAPPLEEDGAAVALERFVLHED